MTPQRIEEMKSICDIVRERIRWVATLYGSKWKDEKYLNEAYLEALEYTVKEADRKRWRIVETDGNPTEEGKYQVVLLFNGWNKEKKQPSKNQFSTVSERYFCERTEENDPFVMSGQEGDLVWLSDACGYPNENVFAWRLIEDIEIPTLPKGVKKWGG